MYLLIIAYIIGAGLFLNKYIDKESKLTKRLGYVFLLGALFIPIAVVTI